MAIIAAGLLLLGGLGLYLYGSVAIWMSLTGLAVAVISLLLMLLNEGSGLVLLLRGKSKYSDAGPTVKSETIVREVHVVQARLIERLPITTKSPLTTATSGLANRD